MKERRKNRVDLIMSVIAGLWGLFFIVFFAVYGIGKFYIDVQVTSDYNEYVSASYRERRGGEVAAILLPDEDALLDCSEILYRHYDSSQKRAWGMDIPDLFCLSVTYNQDDYETKQYEWINQYFTGEDSEKKAEIAKLRDNNPYTSCIKVYCQELENKRYDAFYLIFQPSKNTIHFCFFPSMKDSGADVITLIHHQYTSVL